MLEKDLRDFAYEKALKKAKENDDVLDKEGYAKFVVECESNFRGMAKRKLYKQQYGNTNISAYLDLIRQKKNEYAMILSFKDGLIQEKFIICGNESSISAERYFVKNDFGESAIDFMLRWIEAGAQICNYHNHPMTIAAIPSDNDIISLSNPFPSSVDEWTIAVEKYKKDLPNGFKYDDWGIVTPFDFFSYSQALENGTTIDSLLEQNKKDKKSNLEGILKFIKKDSLSYLKVELELCDL